MSTTGFVQQLSVAIGRSKVHGVPHWTVLFVAQVSVGGMVSTTVTIWLQKLLLLQQSEATHVRMMNSGHWPLVIVLITVTTGLEQQRSVASGGSNVHGVPHWTVLFVAQVSVGGVVSTIVTVSVHVLVLPQQSLASQIRVMNCGQMPFVKVPSTKTPCRQQLSVATGVPNSHGEPHSTVRLLGQEVNTGGIVSTTVIVWLHVFVLPQQSLATQVPVMSCGHVPLVTTLPRKTACRQQLSVADGASNCQGEPHSTVRLVGQ
jgi:hypothetical protein